MNDAKKVARPIIERFAAAKVTEAASIWAENHFILAEPKIKGPFTLRGREYLRQMVDAWGPLPEGLKGGTDFITCAGTGIGKTIGNMAGICFRLANDPTRALIVKPTSGGPAGAKSFSKTRLQKAIRATKCLSEKIPSGAFRFDFSSSQMQINGSTVDLTGSNSVGQLGENRCDIVWQDEIDKYPTQTETSKEANPIVLADERTKSVQEARRYKQSTPTMNNTGIWEEFKKTDQRRYFMPCPHCNKEEYETKLSSVVSPCFNSSNFEESKKGWVVFAWSKQFSVFEQKGFEAYIKWDDKARNTDGTWNLEKVVQTAHMVCPHCQGKILNSHKHEMISRGKWVATATGVPGYIGWHLPSMYSTARDCDFGAMAKKFLAAKHSVDGVKGFINSDLAEPDMNQSISVDRVGTAGRTIEITQEWLKILSVDHQQMAPYFWYMIRAWNGSNAAHGIECGSFMQWSEMDEIQAKHKIIPQAVVVDARFNRAEVLQNCASLEIATRGNVEAAIQDALPLWNGWNPAMAFGDKREFQVKENGAIRYQPFRWKGGHDPYLGTELAKRMEIQILEFKSDIFEDRLENVRQGKTFFKWTISPEVDTEEYAKHMAGKVRKSKKNNPRDYSWVQRRTDWADHIRSCELLGFTLAYSLNLISYDAIQTNEPKEQNEKERQA